MQLFPRHCGAVCTSCVYACDESVFLLQLVFRKKKSCVGSLVSHLLGQAHRLWYSKWDWSLQPCVYSFIVSFVTLPFRRRVHCPRISGKFPSECRKSEIMQVVSLHIGLLCPHASKTNSGCMNAASHTCCGLRFNSHLAADV